MVRLPQPGSDDGTWGDLLNEYLSQSHKTDGSLKDNSVGASQLQDSAVTAAAVQDGSITETQLATAVTTKLNNPTPADGSITNAKVAANAAISADKLADGSTNKVYTATEKTKLAGLDTVLAGKMDLPSGTAAVGSISALRKTNGGFTLEELVTQEPTAADVGLGNVDNTSDATKPVSGPQRAAFGYPQADALAVGQETLTRNLTTSNSLATGTGTLRLSFFTARKTETVTQVRVLTGSTVAAPTPTLIRIGLYAVDESGGATLVGATANDTTLFGTAAGRNVKALAASANVVAGQRYALGVLVVTSAAAPTLVGANLINGSEAAEAPRTTASLAGQTDLPASIVAGSLTASTVRFYGVILP